MKDTFGKILIMSVNLIMIKSFYKIKFSYTAIFFVKIWLSKIYKIFFYLNFKRNWWKLSQSTMALDSNSILSTSKHFELISSKKVDPKYLRKLLGNKEKKTQLYV